MRRVFATTASVALVAVTLGMVGCEQARPWRDADEQLGVLTRELADEAEQEDADYFKGLTPARERIPTLMEQVVRSEIATTYAEHLVVESDTDATLVYTPGGDADLDVPFTVRLSLRNGEPRVDQIVIGAQREAGVGRVGTPTAPDVSAESTTAAMVVASIPSDSPTAGTWQSALIRYTNTSGVPEWLSQPLISGIVITYTTGEPVSEWESRPGRRAGAIRLAPFESTYQVVRFKTPGPGLYLLRGHANGVRSPMTNLHVIAGDGG